MGCKRAGLLSLFAFLCVSSLSFSVETPSAGVVTLLDENGEAVHDEAPTDFLSAKCEVDERAVRIELQTDGPEAVSMQVPVVHAVHSLELEAGKVRFDASTPGAGFSFKDRLEFEWALVKDRSEEAELISRCEVSWQSTKLTAMKSFSVQCKALKESGGMPSLVDLEVKVGPVACSKSRSRS